MKATFDIPDDLYRRVKARSSLEGRSLRSVAVELFQGWLSSAGGATSAKTDAASEAELARYPWLAIAAKHVKPGTSHDMDAIRESIARGWAVESAEKSGNQRQSS